MTTPTMIRMSGYHCRRSGPICGIKPRFDIRKSAPTMISTMAPVRDRNAMDSISPDLLFDEIELVRIS